MLVRELRDGIREGEGGLRHVPEPLKCILRDDCWQERVVKETGERVTFTRFADFVSTPPLEGLGADLALLRRLLNDDPEALDLLDRACQGKQGERTDIGNNVPKVSRPEGNTSAKALRRLRKDRPDLHAAVLAGEKSPHGAMVEAGFRPRTVTLPIDVERAAAALWRARQQRMTRSSRTRRGGAL